MTGITQAIPLSQGTWTPADNSGATLVFTSVAAGYAKIGPLVSIWGTFTYPVTANGAAAGFSGLPYPVSATAGATSAFGAVRTNSSTIIQPIGFLFGLTTNGYLNYLDNTGIAGAVLNSAMSGSLVRFFCTYPTDS